MSDKRHCDTCDTVIKTQHGANYYTLTHRVESYGGVKTIMSAANMNGTWHFCTRACLETFLERHESRR